MKAYQRCLLFLLSAGAAMLIAQPPAPEPQHGDSSGGSSKRSAIRFKEGETVEVLVAREWKKAQVLVVGHDRYSVQFPDGTRHWMRLAQVRKRAAATPIGQPPKPGLASCAGKIEGKYASARGFPNILFRSGKASVEGDEEVECWMGAGKIYLHTPGARADQDFVMDLRKDGSLDTPLGEIRKKGN